MFTLCCRSRHSISTCFAALALASLLTYIQMHVLQSPALDITLPPPLAPAQDYERACRRRKGSGGCSCMVDAFRRSGSAHMALIAILSLVVGFGGAQKANERPSQHVTHLFLQTTAQHAPRRFMLSTRSAVLHARAICRSQDHDAGTRTGCWQRRGRCTPCERPASLRREPSGGRRPPTSGGRTALRSSRRGSGNSPRCRWDLLSKCIQYPATQAAPLPTAAPVGLQPCQQAWHSWRLTDRGVPVRRLHAHGAARAVDGVAAPDVSACARGTRAVAKSFLEWDGTTHVCQLL